MRRIQFIEFHEQPWFPSLLRDYVTDALQFGFNFLRLYGAVAPLLQSALDASESRSIVDLCSGGGGPWFHLSQKLHAPSLDTPAAESLESRGNPAGLQIWLTDKYPNLGALKNVDAVGENQIRCYPGAVDAMRVPPELKGFRTMFTSFHHFPTEEARAILQNAIDAGEGIAIFEIPRRALATIGLTFGFVFMLFVSTPWIRPFRWSRLLWTYFLPILPLVLLFDGVVSCLRTYRPPELREMVAELKDGNYRWQIGEHSTGASPIAYLIGYPPESAAPLDHYYYHYH
jgi:hypothetical protein